MSDENIMNQDNSEEISAGVKIVEEKGIGYTLTVERENLLKAASALKEAGFDLFLFVGGIDYPESIKLTYRVYSSKRQNKLAVMIKTEVPKSDPTVDSLVPLWSAANWHERETFDLYGVIFKGHPDLRRIFMPQDWVGYPLRKDYSDDHMTVMDDGKKDKEKAAAKDKPAAAAPKESAEKVEKKTAEAPEQPSEIADANEVSTDGSDKNE
ncbi:MAG: NADH-quinone oxidoreductase subunit C [Candidatus Aquicultor sp.]